MPREAKPLAQSHRAHQWRNGDLPWVPLILKPLTPLASLPQELPAPRPSLLVTPELALCPVYPVSASHQIPSYRFRPEGPFAVGSQGFLSPLSYMLDFVPVCFGGGEGGL